MRSLRAATTTTTTTTTSKQNSSATPRSRQHALAALVCPRNCAF